MANETGVTPKGPPGSPLCTTCGDAGVVPVAPRSAHDVDPEIACPDCNTLARPATPDLTTRLVEALLDAVADRLDKRAREIVADVAVLAPDRQIESTAQRLARDAVEDFADSIRSGRDGDELRALFAAAARPAALQPAEVRPDEPGGWRFVVEYDADGLPTSCEGCGRKGCPRFKGNLTDSAKVDCLGAQLDAARAALKRFDRLPPRDAPAGTRGGGDAPRLRNALRLAIGMIARDTAPNEDQLEEWRALLGDSFPSPADPALSPAREPAPAPVEQLVDALHDGTGESLLVNREKLARALAATDDNTLRRMLAAVEGESR